MKWTKEQLLKEGEMGFRRELREWEDETIGVLCKKTNDNSPKLAVGLILAKLDSDLEGIKDSDTVKKLVAHPMLPAELKNNPVLAMKCMVSGLQMAIGLIDKYGEAMDINNDKLILEMHKIFGDNK